MNANDFNCHFEHFNREERDAELRILIALNIDRADEREKMHAYVTSAPAEQWRARAVAYARALQTWQGRGPRRMESREAFEERVSREWDESLRTLASFLTPRKERP